MIGNDLVRRVRPDHSPRPHNRPRGLAAVLLLSLSVGLPALPCWALDTPESADGTEAWTVSAALMAYWLPDDDQFTSPTLFVDRGNLHFEARYNYENLDTASVWTGYNSSFGDTVSVDFTPMIGLVWGDTNGIAPGYHLTVGWRAFEFYSEGEYVFDRDDSSNSYFYSWSEMTWSPADWLRFGLAAQRTRVYKTERDIQRGLVIGVALSGLSLGAYVFNPDDDDPTYIASVAVDF